MQIRKPLCFTSHEFYHEVQKLIHHHTGTIAVNESEYATLLIGYMNKNNVEIVEFLIKHPPINPNTIPAFYPNSGKSVLHHAVKKKNPYFVSLLLNNKNVDCNVLNGWGDTPLYAAIEKQDIECVNLFVQNRKTNINKTGGFFFSPLHLSTYLENPQCTQLLLTRSDLKVNKKEIENFTPIFYAIQPTLANAANDYTYSHATTDHLEALLAHPSINVNCVNEWGFTPLLWSMITHKIDCTKLLLKNDFTDINKPGKFGNIPLISAVLTDNTEIIDLFIDNPKTDINAQDSSGYTALMHAVNRKNSACVKKLLSKPHLKINTQNELGETALYIAVTQPDNTECIKLLLATPYHNLNVNLTHYYDETPLARATSYNEIEYVKLLLEDTRTNINVQYKDNGWTPLYSAMINNYIELVKLFLLYNADVTIQNIKGKTALDKAIKRNYVEIINILQKHLTNKTKKLQCFY